jgi:hypothetical protein
MEGWGGKQDAELEAGSGQQTEDRESSPRTAGKTIICLFPSPRVHR